jgi:hypothetical protein
MLPFGIETAQVLIAVTSFVIGIIAHHKWPFLVPLPPGPPPVVPNPVLPPDIRKHPAIDAMIQLLVNEFNIWLRSQSGTPNQPK